MGESDKESGLRYVCNAGNGSAHAGCCALSATRNSGSEGFSLCAVPGSARERDCQDGPSSESAIVALYLRSASQMGLWERAEGIAGMSGVRGTVRGRRGSRDAAAAGEWWASGGWARARGDLRQRVGAGAATFQKSGLGTVEDCSVSRANRRRVVVCARRERAAGRRVSMAMATGDGRWSGGRRSSVSGCACVLRAARSG